jgi:hypothetical protein
MVRAAEQLNFADGHQQVNLPSFSSPHSITRTELWQQGKFGMLQGTVLYQHLWLYLPRSRRRRLQVLKFIGRN